MKTTKKDFRKFKDYFRKFAFNIMGLKNYKAYFRHENINSYADIKVNIGGQVAVVRFNKAVPCKDIDIEMSAFHESCELLLARLIVLAESRFVDPSDIEEASHEIIRTLEHEWYPFLRKDRNNACDFRKLENIK